jgi:hypothetical protein
MIYRTLYVAALEKIVRFHIVSLSNYTHSKQTYLWGDCVAWQENVVVVIRSIKHYHYSKAYL